MFLHQTLMRSSLGTLGVATDEIRGEVGVTRIYRFICEVIRWRKASSPIVAMVEVILL